MSYSILGNHFINYQFINCQLTKVLIALKLTNTMANQDSQPIPEVLYPHWQNEYVTALLGPESTTLQKRIRVAEIAIHRRIQQLGQDSNLTERQVIGDALANLHSLRDNLGCSD